MNFNRRRFIHSQYVIIIVIVMLTDSVLPDDTAFGSGRESHHNVSFCLCFYIVRIYIETAVDDRDNAIDFYSIARSSHRKTTGTDATKRTKQGYSNSTSFRKFFVVAGFFSKGLKYFYTSFILEEIQSYL